MHLPRSLPQDDTPLAKEMHEELQASWECHHKLPVYEEVQPGAQAVIAVEQVGEARHAGHAMMEKLPW